MIHLRVVLLGCGVLVLSTACGGGSTGSTSSSSASATSGTATSTGASGAGGIATSSSASGTGGAATSSTAGAGGVATSTGASGTGGAATSSTSGAGGAASSSSSGTGGGSGVLPLGTTMDLGVVDCATVVTAAALPAGNATCRTLAVDCPGTETINATVAVIEPASPAIGTIVVHGGGGGLGFLDQKPFLGQLLAAGYRLVDVEWASAWEQILAPNIRVAACRPSTVIRWAYQGPHGGTHTQPFCGHGWSGGSGVMSYAMAVYGMKDYLDYVMLTQGPPFGEMDCGCAPATPGCTPPPLCPEIPNPYLSLPSFLAPWEGLQTCGNGGLSAAELAKLKADSVSTDGGDFDYPQTKMSAWFCAKVPNGTTGGGAYYLAKVTTAGATKPSVFCSPNCVTEDIYSPTAKLSDMTFVTADMVQEMAAGCIPRH